MQNLTPSLLLLTFTGNLANRCAICGQYLRSCDKCIAVITKKNNKANPVGCVACPSGSSDDDKD
ncbi:MAG: hypothetical protein RLZZ367_1127 [Bacteroidota bacterium]|jgi:hypothetical protein